uniref:Uncharacterized protein n=1 Tax=Fagus sylvatica TaxID=28930 RepID=A0A2N9G4U6_FAGSY
MFIRTLTTTKLPLLFLTRKGILSLSLSLIRFFDVIPSEPSPPTLLEALFSTHIVGDKPILVRDFIHSALYDPTHGYFSQRSGSVGVLDKSIRFNQLQGTFTVSVIGVVCVVVLGNLWVDIGILEFGGQCHIV